MDRDTAQARAAQRAAKITIPRVVTAADFYVIGLFLASVVCWYFGSAIGVQGCVGWGLVAVLAEIKDCIVAKSQ